MRKARTSSLPKLLEEGGDPTWPSLSTRMDFPKSHISLARGEFLAGSLANVTDGKGTAQKGLLLVSNLRLLFIENHRGRTISIGFTSIIGTHVRRIHAVEGSEREAMPSRRPGRPFASTQALVVSCRSSLGGHLEFIFKNSSSEMNKFATACKSLTLSFHASRAYREILSCTSIIFRRKIGLRLLHEETVMNIYDGVFNLSYREGHLGRLILTNLRFIWHSSFNAEFVNVSAPLLLLIDGPKTTTTSFGKTLLLEIRKVGAMEKVREEQEGDNNSQDNRIKLNGASTRTMLGFKIDPLELLTTVHDEIRVLYEAALKAPNFGVLSPSISKNVTRIPTLPSNNEKSIMLESIADPAAEHIGINEMKPGQLLDPSAYFADPFKESDRPVVFDGTIGLAVETCIGGHSCHSLWQALCEYE